MQAYIRCLQFSMSLEYGDETKASSKAKAAANGDDQGKTVDTNAI